VAAHYRDTPGTDIRIRQMYQDSMDELALDVPPPGTRRWGVSRLDPGLLDTVRDGRRQ
jgi:hypothetical protein